MLGDACNVNLLACFLSRLLSSLRCGLEICRSPGVLACINAICGIGPFEAISASRLCLAWTPRTCECLSVCWPRKNCQVVLHSAVMAIGTAHPQLESINGRPWGQGHSQKLNRAVSHVSPTLRKVV
jgi:hypothetical protein